MRRNFGLLAVVLLVVLSVGCKRYKFTMFHKSGEGKESVEQQSIFASNDSVAYSKAMTIYYLALRAGNRSNENSRPFIFKPVGYSLFDSEGHNVDSILGAGLTQRIRDAKTRALR